MMNESSLPEFILAPLAAVQRILEQFPNGGIIIGGVAVGLISTPRFTSDVDAMMLLGADEIVTLLEVAANEGLTPRITDVEGFARKSRVVLLQHQPSGIHVDISLGLLPFEIEAVERSSLQDAGTLKIQLPTPEDLVILKAVAHRPKDIADIDAITAMYPNLDWQRVEHWVRQFAEALEMPELWTDVEKLRRKR